MATVGRVLAAGTMAAQTIEVEGWAGTLGAHGKIVTCMVGGTSSENPSPLAY